MLKPAVTATVVGGLGNQLFTFAAAAALARAQGAPLRIDTSTVAHRKSDADTIRAFNLDCSWEDIRRLPLRASVLRAILTRSRWRMAPSGRCLGVEMFSAVSPEDDASLLFRAAPVQVRGFFQTSRYAQILWPEASKRRLQITSPSSWLIDQIQAADEARPIVLHVRRGDYVHHTSFGLLSRQYYVDRIDECYDRVGDRPIWVFSDQPGLADEWRLPRVSEVRSPRGAAEDLLLMSYGSAIVAANSTFSWWGAWMSDPSTHVFMPRPWFQGEDREGMMLDEWTTRDAIWER